MRAFQHGFFRVRVVVGVVAAVLAGGYFASQRGRSGVSAAMPRPAPQIIAPAACSLPGPDSLAELVVESDAIVVGAATCVVRDRPLDPGALEAGMDPQTVFGINVESTLKGDEELTRKVLITGLPPGTSGYVSGSGAMPKLAMGKRYILFLKYEDREDFRKQGYSEVWYGGHTFRGSLVDEGRPTSDNDSVVLVEDGVTRANYDDVLKPEQTDLDKDYEHKVFGVPEEVAVKHIRAVVRKMDGKKPGMAE